MKTSPDACRVTVIVPTYNGLEVLKRCLGALAGQTVSDFRVIVIDNGSADGTSDFIKKKHPQVEIIGLPENAGFARAVNAGIQRGRTPFLILLNNDTLPPPGFIEGMSRALESAPLDVGAINPKVVLGGSSCVDNVGIGLTGRWQAFQIGWQQPLDWEKRGDLEIFGVNAGASIYRRAFFDDVGLFDEDFFAYLEDVDLSIRGRLKGWRFLHDPGVVIGHLHSFTAAKMNEIKNELLSRNYFQYVIKCAPWYTVLRILIFHLILRDAGMMVHYLKSEKGRAQFRKKRGVYRFLFRHAGALWKKRLAVRRSAKCDLGRWINVDLTPTDSGQED